MPSYVIKTALKNNSGRYLIINSTWKDNSFELYVLNDNVALTCQVTDADLKTFSELLKQPFETYYNELKSIFSESDQSSEKYFFVLENTNELKIQFTISNDGLKQKYASFKLEKINYNEAAKSIIDALIHNERYLKNDLMQLNSKITSIEMENGNLKLDLQNKSEELVKQEHELVSKFVLLLNEKKDRISQLYEIIEDHLEAHQCPCRTKVEKTNKKNVKGMKRESSNENLTTPSTSKSSLTSTVTESLKAVHNLSDSENDATDVENEPSPPQKKSLDTQELFGDEELHILPKRVKVDEPSSTAHTDTKTEKKNSEMKRNPDSVDLQFEVDDFINNL